MKKIASVLLICTLIMGLSGCGGGNAGKQLKLEELNNAAGDYQFQELAWESSPSEVEKTLGCELEDMGGVDSLREYKASKSFWWQEVSGAMTCEFGQDKLKTVSIRFSTEEAEKEAFWEELKAELCSLYGEVEESVQTSTSDSLQITTESRNCYWEASENRHTALAISRLSINGEFKYVVLNVYIVPEK